eukprot:283337-Chlamydomonas_euryale.AAC.7
MFAQFKQKNKIDIASNKRAAFKLRGAIEKLKKTLSANSEAIMAVECIMEVRGVEGVGTDRAVGGGVYHGGVGVRRVEADDARQQPTPARPERVSPGPSCLLPPLPRYCPPPHTHSPILLAFPHPPLSTPHPWLNRSPPLHPPLALCRPGAQDTDVRGSLSREQLEQLCAPVFDRLKKPMVQALADAGLTAEDIATVEVIGASTRVPYVGKVWSGVWSRVWNVWGAECNAAAWCTWPVCLNVYATALCDGTRVDGQHASFRHPLLYCTFCFLCLEL